MTWRQVLDLPGACLGWCSRTGRDHRPVLSSVYAQRPRRLDESTHQRSVRAATRGSGGPRRRRVAEKPGSVASASSRSRRAAVDVAERRRDRARVVAQQRVARPEPERLVRARAAPRRRDRAGGAPRPGRRRRGRSASPRRRPRRSSSAAVRIAVIGLEEREVEVDDDAASPRTAGSRRGRASTLRAASSARPAAAWASARAMTYSGSGRMSAARSKQRDRLVEVARRRPPADPGRRATGRGPGRASRARSYAVRGARRVARVDEQVAEQRVGEGRRSPARGPGDSRPRRMARQAPRRACRAAPRGTTRGTASSGRTAIASISAAAVVGLVVPPELDQGVDDDRPRRRRGSGDSVDGLRGRSRAPRRTRACRAGGRRSRRGRGRRPGRALAPSRRPSSAGA